MFQVYLFIGSGGVVVSKCYAEQIHTWNLFAFSQIGLSVSLQMILSKYCDYRKLIA